MTITRYDKKFVVAELRWKALPMLGSPSVEVISAADPLPAATVG